MSNLNKNINRIRLKDYSEFKSEKSNNGGCYGFWTDYQRVEGGWEVSYGTTADFEYCPCCGTFNNHYNYDEEGYECGNFELISADELKKIINEFEKEHLNDNDYSVEYRYD